MRTKPVRRHSALVLKTAAVSAIAVLLAGCSSSGVTRMSSTTFDGPLMTGTVTPQAPVGQAHIGQGAVQPVYSQPAPQPVYSQPAPQPVYQPQAVSPAPVAPQQAQVAARQTPDTGATVTVQPGETVYRIATRNGLTVNQLMAANGITDPSRVKAGQRLVLPGRTAPAAATSSPATAPASSARYTVAANDTLYSIGRRHGVSPDRIAAANNISNTSIRVGQTLVIPGATRIVERPAPAAEPVRTAAVGNAAPVSRVQVPEAPAAYTPPRAEAPQIAPKPAAPKPESEVAALPKPENTAQPAEVAAPSAQTTGRFRWPAKGRIVENFGQKAGGARNDGIKIALPAGTPIRAGEAGVVAYAGDELKGYGNLILIRHADDWVTAYAHASKMNVKRGDRVTRGQVIGEVGQTGAVSSPQLHFEVRKGSQPVDPMRHLASL